MNSPQFVSNFEFSITTDFAVGDKVGQVDAIDEDDGFNGFFNFVQIDQSKSPFYVDLKWVSDVGENFAEKYIINICGLNNWTIPK